MTTRRRWALLGMMLSACSDDTAGNDNGAGDAAVQADAEVCTVPERPYGMAVGQVFPRTAVTDCNTEETYSIYDDPEFCSNEVTVISLAAGW